MNEHFPHLFAPLGVRGTVFKNRLFCAPTSIHALHGSETYPNDEVVAHFADRARGGAALVAYGGITVARSRPGDNMIRSTRSSVWRTITPCGILKGSRTLSTCTARRRQSRYPCRVCTRSTRLAALRSTA